MFCYLTKHNYLPVYLARSHWLTWLTTSQLNNSFDFLFWNIKFGLSSSLSEWDWLVIRATIASLWCSRILTIYCHFRIDLRLVICRLISLWKSTCTSSIQPNRQKIFSKTFYSNSFVPGVRTLTISTNSTTNWIMKYNIALPKLGARKTRCRASPFLIWA